MSSFKLIFSTPPFFPSILFLWSSYNLCVDALMRVGARAWSSNIIYYCQFNNCRLERTIHTHKHNVTEGDRLKRRLVCVIASLSPSPPHLSSSFPVFRKIFTFTDTHPPFPPFFDSPRGTNTPADIQSPFCSSAALARVRCAAPSSTPKHTHELQGCAKQQQNALEVFFF